MNLRGSERIGSREFDIEGGDTVKMRRGGERERGGKKKKKEGRSQRLESRKLPTCDRRKEK